MMSTRGDTVTIGHGQRECRRRAHCVRRATTGAVIQGPATRPLARIPLALGPNGELYVDG